MSITITRQTAELALRNLWQHHREVWVLDEETRAGIVALDELVKVLEAEHLMTVWEREEQEAAQKAQAEYLARKAAAEND